MNTSLESKCPQILLDMVHVPPMFSWAGKVVVARVTKVYDGDTVHLVFVDNNKLVRISARVDGIDTPEIRGKTKREKRKATEARDYAAWVLKGKLVTATLKKTDKYGRTVASITTENDEDFKSLMIDSGYAREYDGGTRQDW